MILSEPWTNLSHFPTEFELSPYVSNLSILQAETIKYF